MSSEHVGLTKEIIEANFLFDRHLTEFLQKLRPELVELLGDDKAIQMVLRKFLCHCYGIMGALGWDEDRMFKELAAMAMLVINHNKAEREGTRQ